MSDFLAILIAEVRHLANGNMKLKDLGIVLLVVAVWGFNFVVIHLMMGSMPPMLLVTLRYALIALPLAPFVKRPNVPLRYVAAYGIMLGTVHQGLLFIGMKVGMGAGLASLVLQTQAFFTLLLAVVVLKERVRPQQIIGLVFALVGLGLIAAGTDQTTSLIGFALVVLSAAMWGVANLISRKAITEAKAPIDPLSFMVWASVFPPLPTLLIAWVLEGGGVTGANHLVAAFGQLDWAGVAGLAFITYGSTLFGFVMWNKLMARYGASFTSQFGLLVPVTGMTSAWLVLREPLTSLEVVAAVFIIVGLSISMFGGRLVTHVTRRFKRPQLDVETAAAAEIGAGQ